MRILALAAAGLIASLLASCATPSTTESMVAQPGATRHAAPGSKGDHSFRIGEVRGGGRTDTLGLSDVSNDVLRISLESSLRNLGYLADDPNGAAYELSIELIDLNRPIVALDPALLFVPIDLSVTARIHYVLKPVSGGPAVFDKVVATTGAATARDAATPAGRVRKANEIAIRLNTISFLERLESAWNAP